MTSSVRARLLAAVAVGTLLAIAAITPTVSAAAATSTGLTVFLKAPDVSALQQLAAAKGLTHAQRVAAVDALLPTKAEHDQVAAALTAEGLTVTSESAWSVSAAGPATTVGGEFGTRPGLPSHPSADERAAATGALPTLPDRLKPVATAAFPTATGPAAFHPAATPLDGNDFRNAYTTPTLTGLGVSPYSGADPAGTLTIATIQLASWNASDLANYAIQDGDANFTPSNVTEVPVDQASVPAPSPTNDDVEVDLDQEAILSTDPYAHQRPYFAPNTNAGFADALSQVLDDVTQNRYAYAGGDPAISVLSSSWGQCEAATGSAEINTIEPILTSLVAAGVTVFASSGDDGIYDCGSTGSAVDYPGSSPEVVGVGGTTLQPVGTSAPNNGANWTESAWSCSSPFSCGSSGDGGSGGGASSRFAMPPYQSATIKDPPFSQSTRRLVPDIAADGNPQTGLKIYTSNAKDVQQFGGNSFVVGGTSLATPVSAALLTNVLAAHAQTGGVGDIHGALYAAYAAGVGAFRDVTSGTNGAAATGGDPSVYAQPGYDTVSGLGGVLWPALAPYLFSKLPAPIVAGNLALATPHSGATPRALNAIWKSTAAAGGEPVGATDVTITRLGRSTPVYRSTEAPTSGSHRFTGVAGATYKLTVTAVDLSDRRSASVHSYAVVPIDDKSFSFSKKWSRASASSDIAGSHAVTSARDASARVKATGAVYALAVRVGPNYGKLAVYRRRAKLATINLYAVHPGEKTITIYGKSSTKPKPRTFTLRRTGTKAKASTSKRVDVDGLYVVY